MCTQKYYFLFFQMSNELFEDDHEAKARFISSILGGV